MGHTKCGAVTAVVKGAELHGHLQALAEKIKPAAEKAKSGNIEGEELIGRAIQANVWQTIEDIIKQSSIVREHLASGKLSILGALYDLELGKVTWLGQHPAEDSLIALASQAATDHSLKEKPSDTRAANDPLDKNFAPLNASPLQAKNASNQLRKDPPKTPPTAEPHGEEQGIHPAPSKNPPKLAGPGDHH